MPFAPVFLLWLHLILCRVFPEHRPPCLRIHRHLLLILLHHPAIRCHVPVVRRSPVQHVLLRPPIRRPHHCLRRQHFRLHCHRSRQLYPLPVRCPVVQVVRVGSQRRGLIKFVRFSIQRRVLARARATSLKE